MAKADPHSVSVPVTDKHYETQTQINKSFIDSSKENVHYKKCSKYAAFMTWTNQYIILVKHVTNESNIKDRYNALRKELL